MILRNIAYSFSIDIFCPFSKAPKLTVIRMSLPQQEKKKRPEKELQLKNTNEKAIMLM